MKRIIIVLAVLALAIPASAAVNVTCYQSKKFGEYNEVIVSYNATSEANNLRAFALNLTLTDLGSIGGAAFNEASDYFIGECNSVAKGYGIFPGTIQIDGSGNVTDWGSPIAPSTAPGAAGSGLGTNKIVIEMGSLYKDANVPLKSGTLLKFRVNDKWSQLTITENTERGGLVMENPNESVTLNAPVFTIICPADICGKKNGPRDGKVDSWDLGRLVNNYGVPFIPTQWFTDTRTDVAGKKYGPPDGNCDSWDLGVLVNNYNENWN